MPWLIASVCGDILPISGYSKLISGEIRKLKGELGKCCVSANAATGLSDLQLLKQPFFSIFSACWHWNVPISCRLLWLAFGKWMFWILCVSCSGWNGVVCVWDRARGWGSSWGGRLGGGLQGKGLHRAPSLIGWSRLPWEMLTCTRKEGATWGCWGNRSGYCFIGLLLFQPGGEICRNVPGMFWFCLALNAAGI